MKKSHLKNFILSGITTGVIASSSINAANANNPQNLQQAPSSTMDASQNYSSDANSSPIPSRSGMMENSGTHRSSNPFENKIDKNQSTRAQSAIRNGYSAGCGGKTDGGGKCGAKPGIKNGNGCHAVAIRNDNGKCGAKNGPSGGSCGSIAWEDQSTNSQGKQWDKDSRWDQSQTKPNWGKNAEQYDDSRGHSTPDSRRTGVERVGKTDSPLAMWGWGEDKKDAHSQDAKHRQDAAETRGRDASKTWSSDRENATPYNNGVRTKTNTTTDGQLALEDDYTPKKPPQRVSNQRPNKIINGHNKCSGANGCG